MQERSFVVSNQDAVQTRLLEIGTSQQAIQRAVLAGHEAAASATRHHPVSYAGYVAWAEAIKVLRDIQVSEMGWSPEDIVGQPLVVSPDGRQAITAAGGDAATGQPGPNRPKTRTPKGAATFNAAASNTPWLFESMAAEELAWIDQLQNRETWMLLVYRDLILGETRSELSKPTISFSGSRKNRRSVITDWSERIILPPIPFDGVPITQNPELQTPRSGESGEIRVEIRRRA